MLIGQYYHDAFCFGKGGHPEGESATLCSLNMQRQLFGVGMA
ncbi:hypothetical protein [Cyclonatronum sp.]|nr:hypothetical protein [Cyclonatronum sp.]